MMKVAYIRSDFALRNQLSETKHLCNGKPLLPPGSNRAAYFRVFLIGTGSTRRGNVLYGAGNDLWPVLHRFNCRIAE